jgi:hypothetical protein
MYTGGKIFLINLLIKKKRSEKARAQHLALTLLFQIGFLQ